MSQIETQRRELAEEANTVATQITQAVATKAYGELGGLKSRLAELSEANEGLDQAAAHLSLSAKHAAVMFGGADLLDPNDVPDAAADNGQRLTFNAKMAKGLIERKSLASSGAAVVGQEFRPDPIALGKPATGLLDVLPVVPHTSPEYAYMQQTTRTNNAAVWDGTSAKPTSVYGVTKVAKELSVIAHLSEGIQHYWLSDNPTLLSFVSNELQYGLSRAVETKVLSDINGTSGIVTQAWATSIPVTLRKAMTALETSGYTASAIVLHPSDFETIELALSTTNAVEHQGLPYDAASRRLYGVPIATTISQTAGVGHVVAGGAVAVDTDTLGVQLTWSETSNADDWSKNLTRARLEGRWGTSVYLPGGVVKATLAGS